MSALEIKILIYGVIALAFAGGNIWVGCHFTASHYQALIERDRQAQNDALLAAQQKVIAAEAAQQAASQAAEKQYADLKATSDGLAQQLASSVSGYAALHRGILSAAASAAAVADAARQGAQRDSQLAELVRQATSACEGDAAELTALQTWANALSR